MKNTGKMMASAGKKMMASADIRERFLRFFEARGHARVASSPLVPGNDPTLLFTNSGMVQFKDVFLGFDKRPYKRATTAQRCLRAGGKHNDLANVGYTSRHHTFFEMLGNFSFGDYFKEGAIPLAWEFLTDKKEGLGLEPRHLWITVFGGGKLFGEQSPPVPPDEDAFALWRQTLIQNAGFSAEDAERRIARIPTADNFWMMGDAGPCGPCSEIFYNRDINAARFEGDIEAKADDCIEIWNLVFMQYNRDASGELRPLPAPCVDTGMGLERISAVMQNADGNYQTDIFRALSAAATKALGITKQEVTDSAAVRVIADHIRAAAFMIADGIAPSNEGRGYVLRRIIRRALYHGQKTQAADKLSPWFYLLADDLTALMGAAYPELRKQSARIKETIQREEQQFARTCIQGQARLSEKIAALSGKKQNAVPGDIAFELYDTYGFPPDATRDYAMEKGFRGGINEAEFDKLMTQQRARSRAAMKFKAEQTAVEYKGAATKFCGYDCLEKESEVAAIFINGDPAREAKQNADALIILAETPFYAEAGGQIGDAGELQFNGGSAKISDARRLRADVTIHAAVIKQGALCVGDKVYCRVDGARRANIARNHSATHLMHAALRESLGANVAQKGSLVAADHLRFDFSHHAPVDKAALREIEEIVNSKIRADLAVVAETMPYKDALGKGATALFGEKYGDKVRVVTMDASFSMELCGGTHIARTGEIGYFIFTAESAAAAGIRRVEALTAAAATRRARETMDRLEEIASSLKSPADKIEVKIARLQESLRAAQKQTAHLAAARANAQKEELKKQARQKGGVNLIVAEAGDAPSSSLRTLADELRNETRPAAVLLISEADGRALLSCAVDKTLSPKIKAREWINIAAAKVDGKGGGRDDSAQGAGNNPAKIKDALSAAQKWAEDKLA
jgi:alanyl-tRNA synthetase